MNWMKFVPSSTPLLMYELFMIARVVMLWKVMTIIWQQHKKYATPSQLLHYVSAKIYHYRNQAICRGLAAVGV
jgi:hypothetical protein